VKIVKGLIVAPLKNLLFSKVSRYIYKELIPNYAFGLAFFSSLILLNEFFYMARLYIEHNVPIKQVFLLLMNLIPFLLSFSVPFAVLPAYLLTMGRLSQDSEIVGFKSCGISTRRIMIPGLFIGFLISLFSILFNNYVVIPSNENYIRLRAKIMAQKPAVEMKATSFIELGSYRISYEKIEYYGNIQILYKIHAVDFKDRKTIQAKKGKLYVDPENAEHYIIKFIDGNLSEIIKEKTNDPVKGEIEEEKFFVSTFRYLTIHFYVGMPSEFYSKGPDLMKIDELYKDILNSFNIVKEQIDSEIENRRKKVEEMKLLENIIFGYQKEFDENTMLNEALDAGNKLINVINEISIIDERLENLRKNLPYFSITKYNEKFALPFSSFIFALISLAIGIYTHRSGRGEGLGLSIIIMVMFYGLKTGIENLIFKQLLPPLAEWFPDFLFLIIALILIIPKFRQ